MVDLERVRMDLEDILGIREFIVVCRAVRILIGWDRGSTRCTVCV